MLPFDHAGLLLPINTPFGAPSSFPTLDALVLIGHYPFAGTLCTDTDFTNRIDPDCKKYALLEAC